MELRMTVNESWVHQGRQAHGYFGNGTSPKDDNAAGVSSLFRPANAGQRVDYAASSLIMHVPRNDRGRWNSAVSDSARANLKTAVAAWYGARLLSRDAFRARFLDPYTSDEMVDHLRSAARGMIEGQTYDDLAKAGENLAAAAQKVGADGWPRFLSNASHQAVAAVSKGNVPGVVRVGAGDDAAGLAGLAFLGLLAIVLGTPRPSISVPSRTPAVPSSPSLPNAVEAVAVPPPKQDETPTDVLKPNGQNVGEPGKSSGVRILPGGEAEAKELFDRLTKNKGGQDITPSTHVGQVVRLPDGSIIGIRPTSKSGPPTIDIKIPGLGVRELKFPGRVS